MNAPLENIKNLSGHPKTRNIIGKTPRIFSICDRYCVALPNSSFQAKIEKMQNMTDKFTSLKCSICNFVLSVPPVMTITKDGNTYKCGRCKHIPDKDVAVRCTLFESIAESMKFPCSYEDCGELLAWNEVSSHEKQCVHRTLKCPVYYQKCQAQVKISDLESHMQQNHKYNIYYDKMAVEFSLELELTKTLNYTCLLISDDHKFLVYILEYEIVLMALEPSINKNYHYNLEITNASDDSPKLTYKYRHVKEFDERFDCSECFNKQCHLRHHPCSTVNSKKNFYKRRLAFDKKQIENLFGKSKVSFTVFVERNDRGNDETTKSTPVEKTVGLIVEDYNVEIIRKNLECPLCSEYMWQEIYTCITGHVICHKCKSLLKGCPSCQASILNTRNFALENIAEIAKLSCINQKFGCNITGNLEMIAKHEIDCSFDKS